MNNLKVRFEETEREGRVVYIMYNHGEWIVTKWDNLDSAMKLLLSVLAYDKDCKMDIQDNIPWKEVN